MTRRIFDYLAGHADALRKCQREALEAFARYRQGGETERAFLVNLPTGAGKTGVIALISHLCDERKVLVVCHRKAVKLQLFREISKKFFRETMRDNDVVLKDTHRDGDFNCGDGVYITTFQKLSFLNDDELSEVQSGFDLILVDEGHSEPSPVWREIIRQSEAVKVVVTATPYRNDLFELNVSTSSYFVYTFRQACEDGVIVGPEFRQVDEGAVLGVVSDFLNINPGLKCIVKCKSFEDMEQFHRVFSAEFVTVIIHDRVVESGVDLKFRSVAPALKVEGVRVLIHQHKLDEGVDIPEAKLLVLTYALGSGRELVQSIGRVVRQYQDAIPVVVDVTAGANEGMWSGFASFDSYLSTRDGAADFIKSLGTSYLIESFLDGFPQYSYFGGRFRKRVDLNDISPEDDINIPLASVCFIQKNDNFSLPLLMDRIYWELHGAGALVKRFEEVLDISLMVYVSFSSSRFFSDKLFFEPKLNVLIVKETNECLAVYDSGSGKYYNQEKYGLGPSINIGKLTALAASTPVRVVKETHARAVGGLGSRPEMVALKAQDLATSQASQRNSRYALSMLRFDNYGLDGKKSASVYVGARSGRVVDQLEGNYTLRDLSDWIDTVVLQMQSAGSVGRLIKSYAQPSVERPACNPVSIIFDFSSMDNSIQVRGGILDPDFYYVDGNQVFVLSFGQESIDFELVYDEAADQYSVELSGRSIGVVDFDVVVGYINANKNFKILFEDGTTYFHGAFYRIALPYEQGIRPEDSWASSVLFGMAGLQVLNLREKGLHDPVRGYFRTTINEFDPCSIFYKLDLLKGSGLPGVAISDLGEFARYIPGCDLVVCSDMGTEPADFILSSPEKLCFVHVKCGDAAIRPGASAGALAEVGSQAIKNIHYLISSNDVEVPGNFGVWNDAWPNFGAVHPLSTRYRLFNGVSLHPAAPDGSTSSAVWQLICERRRNVQCKKEIWVVVGNSFSKQRFIENIELGAAAPVESIQAYQLIEDWLGVAEDYDVELKIFTSN